MADFINEPQTGMYFKAAKDGPLIVMVDGIAVGECTGDTTAIMGMLWRQGQPSLAVDVKDEYLSMLENIAILAMVLIFLGCCGYKMAQLIDGVNR